MASELIAAVAIVFLGFFSMALHGQGSSVTLAAIDGRSGKAISHQRLVAFMGSSQEEVGRHKHSAELTTDGHGIAVLPIPQGSVKWIQVFADFQTLCQSEPNNRSFSLVKVLSDGEASPNNCSSFRQELKPGQLIVFARPPTFREKMDW